MPFFRVQLQQYIEDEFDSKEEAVERFLEFLEDRVGGDDLTVEEFDDDTAEWNFV